MLKVVEIRTGSLQRTQLQPSNYFLPISPIHLNLPNRTASFKRTKEAVPKCPSSGDSPLVFCEVHGSGLIVYKIVPGLH